MALFPFVPFAPGVPPVNRNATNIGIPTIQAVFGDAPSVVASNADVNQWGLFDSSGAVVLEPDSVVALDDFRHEFKLSTFPIEGVELTGQASGFSTYNKVAEPFEGRFIFNKGGSINARADFMSSLESVVADTNLYVLSTPEIAYQNVNVAMYRLRRRADQGFQLISVEIALEEVRSAATPQFSNTQDPTAQSPTGVGAVQPVAPTGAQVAQAQSAISPEGVGTLVIGPPGD